ncbi:uncharacterized protein LOC112044329 [Bicyclus anynana]|uniref:Uncharacterized protein LOC112044329 n=1 Tax=Bicyclus anynana TaxID=110368 RepID=A0A6J1MSM2_BICAN|nr:uncharacterized protein LOC112044329 [Bicyclus anynana]
MSKLYGVLLLLVATHCVTSTTNTYVYEFGQNVGNVVFQYDGRIPLLQPVTHKDISIPPGVTVTYVRVTVDALSPPKVDFEADRNRVSIVYSWTQISMSSYSIIVKGFIV